MADPWSALRLERSGGASLLCASRRDVPLITGAVLLQGGLRETSSLSPGIADLACDLLNLGPQGWAPLAWERELESQGLRLSLGLGEETWALGFECLTQDWPKLKELLRQWVKAPSLDKNSWGRLVREHRLHEKEAWAQPSEVLEPLAYRQSLGPDHPLARPATEKDYQNARYEEAQNLAQRLFQNRPPMYGILGGDMEEEQALGTLEEILGLFGARAQDSPPPNPQPRASRQKVWVMDHPDVDQVSFALHRPAPLGGHPQRVALRMARYALAEGDFSSRLMRRIRVDQGHTYGIRLSCPERSISSPLTLSSFTRKENFGEMLAQVRDALSEAVENGFDEEEIQGARDHLTGSLPLALTSPRALLQHGLSGLRFGLEPSDLRQDWVALAATSREEVNQALGILLGDLEFQMALIGPAADCLAPLGQESSRAVFSFQKPPLEWPKP